MSDRPPWMHPFPYSPGGNFGFNNQGGLGPLAGMLSAQYLQQFAGPTNFLPHQTPGQNVMDQMVMQQYFRSTQQNTFGTNRMGTPAAANVILGGMSAFTDQPMTDLNRQFANQAASIINHPHLKPILAAAVGPENLEAAMFGPKGDPGALAGAANRIGYYRNDPATGARRMSGDSLESFSRGLYANLYEPSGDVGAMAKEARAGNKDQLERLKKAANAGEQKVVDDSEITKRITDLGSEEVGKIYKKYVAGGKATTAQEQAQELVKFDRAIKNANVLGTNETSIAGLQRGAENASVEGMHGFMAGQTGQVAEHLFQRGMLPQSIGALSAADRVKVLAKEELDAGTKTRLAREFGHRDLMEKNTDYAAAFNSGNTANQEQIMQKNLADYEDRIDTSMKAVKKAAASRGQISADQAEKLLTMDGMDTVAGNVDAKRSGAVVKKHTEALAAIREIFGDNGNPNAPVPALLAALDHLSQGTSHRMSSNKVASTLREMRGTAKELGMGIDQLGSLSAGVEAYGTQLGLAGETRMGAVADTLSTLKVMDRSGSFANAKFGSMSREEAQQRIGMLATRSEASAVSRGSATIMRAYEENKGKFTDASGKANTELGVIAQKMKDPNWDGSYTFDGKTRNFYTETGRGGMREFNRIADGSGMTPSQFRTLMNDQMTQEYQQQGAGLKAARADIVNRLSNSTVLGTVGRGTAGIAGLSDRTEKGAATRKAIADQLTSMVIDTANLDGAEQLEYLEKTLPEEMAKTIAQQEGRDTPNAEDKKKATQLVSGMFGADKETRISRLQTTVSRISQQTNRFGAAPNTRSLRELLVGTEGLTAEQASRQRDAEQAFAAGLGMEGTPFARGAGYLAEIGVSGEKFNMDEFLKTTFGIKSVAEMRGKMAPELGAAFERAERQISDATVSKKYLNDLAAGKATDHKGRTISAEEGKEEIRRLASRGLTGEELAKFEKRFQTEIGDEELKKRREKKFDEIAADETKLKAMYKSAVKGGTATTVKEMKQELIDLGHTGAGTNVAGLRDSELVDAEKGEFTTGQMRSEAERRALGRAKDEGRLAEYEAERAAGMQRFKGMMGQTDADMRLGLRSALISDAKDGKHKAIKEDEMKDLLEKATDAKMDDDAFKKYIDEKHGYLSDKDREKVFSTVSDFRKARKAELGQKVDPNAALPQETPSKPEEAAKPETTPDGKPAPATADGKKEDAATPGSKEKPATAEGGQKVADNVEKLANVIAKLEEPFNKLVAALEQTGGGGDAEGARADASSRPVQEKDKAVQAGEKPARAATIAQRGASSGGGEMTIRGALTINGLQQVVMAARGSPVFTPPGGGAAIVPGNHLAGPDMSSAAVAPAST